MENDKHICIFTDVSLGQQVRLTRLAQGLRQIDLASKAGVTVQEVIRLEKDSFVLLTQRKRILAILGLLDDGNESE